MKLARKVDSGANPQRIAVAILAALQGGLILSQPEKASWPLEAAIDSALNVLHEIGNED